MKSVPDIPFGPEWFYVLQILSQIMCSMGIDFGLTATVSGSRAGGHVHAPARAAEVHQVRRRKIVEGGRVPARTGWRSRGCANGSSNGLASGVPCSGGSGVPEVARGAGGDEARCYEHRRQQVHGGLRGELLRSPWLVVASFRGNMIHYKS